MKKRCIKCGEPKELEEFRVRTKSPDGRQNKCRLCAQEYDNSVYKSQESRRRAIRKNNVDRQNATRAFVAEYLVTHPCVDCGEDDLLVLDFDHRDPGKKKATISSMVMMLYNIEAIKKEIAKCVVRCANCHRRRTAKQQRNWKLKYLREATIR